MLKDILKQTEEKMHKAVEVVRLELVKIRTGKATTALLDGVKVDYYGSLMSLQQVANVSVLDVHTISVQPWDKSMVGPVDKAIIAANLGVVVATTLVNVFPARRTRERSSTADTKCPLLRQTISPPKRVIWGSGAAPVVRRPLAESMALWSGVGVRVATSSLKVWIIEPYGPSLIRMRSLPILRSRLAFSARVIAGALPAGGRSRR